MFQKIPISLASLNNEQKLTWESQPVSERAYFPRSEFHSRFDSHYQMTESKQWNTYHRSAFKKLEGISKTKGDSIPSPKKGDFPNPFAFPSYYAHVTPAPPLTHSTIAAGSWYNDILDYQKKSAHFIVTTFKNKHRKSTVKINCDYDFTGVLIKFPKPREKKVKKSKDWTNFVSLYFIAITDTLAFQKGINIELHRRASFGFLRPAVAECGQSLRISVGFCPKEYLSCIVEAIGLTEKLLQYISIFQSTPLNNQDLINTLHFYNQLNSCHVPTTSTNIWDMLWQGADSKGCSFVYQIFRKEKVVEWVIDELFKQCCSSNFDVIFTDELLFRRILIEPLQHLLRLYNINKRSLSINDTQMTAQKGKWAYHIDITDLYFWAFFNQLATTLGGQSTDISQLMNTKSFVVGYNYLEYLLQNFYFKPNVAPDAATDGYGSDSEGEDDLNFNEQSLTVFSKKFITATGMRAIQLAYAVSRLYLTKNPQESYLTSTEYMYYEAPEALQKSAIPLEEIFNQAFTKNGIIFFDNNYCNIQHKPPINLLHTIQPNHYICCIDVTSSTTTEMNALLSKVFYQKPNIQVIIFISSGLKNEQSFSDYNPYGCLRLFTRDKQVLTNMHQNLITLEEIDNYKHPKTSHLLRLQAKQHGMTPTRQAIFKQAPAINDLLCDSLAGLQM